MKEIYIIALSIGLFLTGCADSSSTSWHDACLNEAYLKLKVEKDVKSRTLLNRYVHMLSAVARGRDIDAKDVDGSTLLILAVRNEDVRAVNELTGPKFFAESSCQDSSGMSALRYAVQSKNIEIIRRLVEIGTDLDLKDNQHGRTALIDAVLLKDVETIKVLVEAGASVEIKDNSGKSARDYAYLNGEIATLNMLSKERK